ncbi:MAG: ATP-binding protein [Sphaerochaetaceae bacterium]|nr:ATP-binding protein [Sphaerochaetaceae bacterium]
MNTIVRLINLKINDFKNVREGEIKTATTFESMDKSDIVGIYGQNGSGKTAVVNALYLLKILLDGHKLPSIKEYLIYLNEDQLKLSYEFLIINNLGEFFIKYNVRCINGKDRLEIAYEDLLYKKNIEKAVYKRFVTINKANSKFGDSTKTIKKSDKVSIDAALDFLPKDRSLVFNDKLFKIYKKILNEKQISIFYNLKNDFTKNFHVISDTQNGIVLANMMISMDINVNETTRNINYQLNDSIVIESELYKYLEKSILEINEVLRVLVPELTIEVNKIGSELLDDGKEGIRFEFISLKNNRRLPLRCESAGVLKIISILSSLIAVNNNPNALVVIDELDSGIFEVLLGQIIKALNENGKGQLIFTSHNLRILEVLNSKQLFFTTLNEKHRFIRLRKVNKTNNIRDMYIRAAQLGGQSEELYDYRDVTDIKMAFLDVGLLND